MQNLHALLWENYKVLILLPLGFDLFIFSFNIPAYSCSGVDAYPLFANIV